MQLKTDTIDTVTSNAIYTKYIIAFRDPSTNYYIGHVGASSDGITIHSNNNIILNSGNNLTEIVGLEFIDDSNNSQEIAFTENNRLQIIDNDNKINNHETKITDLENNNLTSENEKILTFCNNINWAIFFRLREDPFERNMQKSSWGSLFYYDIGNYNNDVLLDPDGSRIFRNQSGNITNIIDNPTYSNGVWKAGKRRIKLSYNINLSLFQSKIYHLFTKIVVCNSNTNPPTISNIMRESLLKGKNMEVYDDIQKNVIYSDELDVVMEDGYTVFLATQWDIFVSSEAYGGPLKCDCKFYIFEY